MPRVKEYTINKKEAIFSNQIIPYR
ncbi:hypothetical protein [Paenibacillus sp. J45TS6]